MAGRKPKPPGEKATQRAIYPSRDLWNRVLAFAGKRPAGQVAVELMAEALDAHETEAVVSAELAARDA